MTTHTNQHYRPLGERHDHRDEVRRRADVRVGVEADGLHAEREQAAAAH